jgi:hypothetical protein
VANHTLDRNGRRQLDHGHIVSDIDFVLSNNEGEIPNVSVKRSSHPQPSRETPGSGSRVNWGYHPHTRVRDQDPHCPERRDSNDVEQALILCKQGLDVTLTYRAASIRNVHMYVCDHVASRVNA